MSCDQRFIIGADFIIGLGDGIGLGVGEVFFGGPKVTKIPVTGPSSLLFGTGNE